MESYRSFCDVIDGLGGSAAFGRVIGKPIGTASAMKTRDVIPPAYWEAVVRGAAKAGLDGVTYELLAKLYAARNEAA